MESDQLQAMVPLLRKLLSQTIENGDGSSLLGLRRRIESLLEPADPLLTSRHSRRAAMELERQIWTMAIIDLLLPDVRAALTQELRASRLRAGLSQADNPWRWIDDDEREARDAARASTSLRARRAVARSCLRFQQTGKAAYLREAVRTIEGAIMSVRRPDPQILTELTCPAEAECLHAALRNVLGSSASCFFVGVVRNHIHTTVPTTFRQPRPSGGGFGARGLRGEQWLSRAGWTTLGYPERWTAGAWFVAQWQDAYDRYMRDGLRKREEENQRLEVAQAEMRRQMSGWTTPPGKTLAEERPDRDKETRDETTAEAEATSASAGVCGEATDRVTVHFVDDGFTGLGRIWFRGMELRLDRGSPGWERTCDPEGKSWLELTDALQEQRYGRVMFRPGRWPGEPWPKDQRESFLKDYSQPSSWETEW
jgi:hypothetical protein